ncbi:MAG: type II secretion system GspH family protein [Planctomycetes bacterium]|nr:type II secretion system GspH family protein [Planctomycetota bacterium]
MKARIRKSQGFTLVEILIVVVILGILAAIVIPQFTNASETAKASSLQSQLQTIRSQLELAQIQHQGTYPPLIADSRGWGLLTTETEQSSSYTAGDSSGNEVGPYLQQSPANPFTANTTATSVAAAAAAGVGWVYSPTTGQFRACLPAAKATDLNLTNTNDVVTY